MYISHYQPFLTEEEKEKETVTEKEKEKENEKEKEKEKKVGNEVPVEGEKE